MHVYREVLSVSTRKRTDICEFAQHGVIHKSTVSVIANMYTCEHMYVYKEVLSVSTRKGTDVCEFAQHGLIYKSVCDVIYVFLQVYACIQRGSKYEHSQGHRHM